MPMLETTTRKRLFIYVLTCLNCLVINASLEAQVIDSLKKQSQVETGQKLTKIYSDLCWEYRYEKPDSALFFGNKAIANALQTNDQSGLAQAYNDLAIIHILSSQLTQADSLLLAALQIELDKKDTVRIAAIQNKLAIVAQKRGDLRTALHYNLKTLTLYEELNADREQSMILNNIGIIHNNLNELQVGMRYFKRSFEIKMHIGDSSEAAGTLVNVGGNYEKARHLDSALMFYQKARNMLVKCNGNPEYLAGSYNSLGRIYQELEQFDSALVNYQQALRFRAGVKDNHALAVTYSNMARMYLIQENRSKLKETLDSALQFAIVAEAGIERVDIYQLYSAYYSLIEDASSTFKYAVKAFDLNDSLLGENSRQAIAEFEAQFESVKKEKEIVQLNKDKAEASLAISRQRNWIMSLGAGLFLVLLLFWFLNYRKKQHLKLASNQRELRFNKELLEATVLAQEKERQRIAKELHDGLAQSIAALKLGIQRIVGRLQLDQDAKTSFDKHMHQLDDAAEEVREISHQMMPQTLLELGLIAAMEEMLDKTLNPGGFQYEFEHYGIKNERFAQPIEIGLFRIAQELVNNIIKHSGAKHASIQLYKTKKHLILHIEDDGSGFSPGRKHGLGLNNIYSRASSVKGEVNYESGIPNGTVANVRIPISSQEETQIS